MDSNLKRVEIIENSSLAISRESDTVRIIYGSHTGNCARLAQVTQNRILELGIEVKVCDMGSFETKQLQNIRKLLLIKYPINS